MQASQTHRTDDQSFDTVISPQCSIDSTIWFTEAAHPAARLRDHRADQTTAPLHPVEVASLRLACATLEHDARDDAETNECPIGPPEPAPSGSCEKTMASERMAATPAVWDTHDALLEEIATAASHVHEALGPGLLEVAYAQCLAHELSLRGLRTAQHVALPLVYKGVHVAFAARISLVVEERVAVLIETVDALLPAHEARARGMLALADLRDALVLNFHAASMTYGVRRIAREPAASSLRRF